MFKKIKNRGNMIFVLTISSLVMTIASAIGILCYIMLNSANDEIENNRLNFISSSAKAQILYRLQATQYKNNPEELRNLLEKDWEKIALGSENNFVFDPSFDSSFAIDEYCQAKIDFNNGKYSSKCNFYGTSTSNDVPAYSMDLKISAFSNNKRKVFRAMISKKWPFCLSSGDYKANIQSGCVIDGDIYSGFSDGNIGISVKNSDYFPSEISGDLIVKRASSDKVRNHYNMNELSFIKKDDEFGISFDSESEEKHKGNIIYTENNFYSSGVNNAIASLVSESNPKIIDNILLNKKILKNIREDEISGNSAKEYISSKYDIDKHPYMRNTISSFTDQLEELLKTSSNIYILQKNLKLAGFDCEVGMINPTLSDSSAYKIDGTVIAFPSCFQYCKDNKDEEIDSFGIEARNCTLYINGDLILIGDSENLRLSSQQAGLITNNDSLKNVLNELTSKNSSNGEAVNYIPFLKGTKTSIVVFGNIFLSGGYIESAEERLAIYSNENMYLKPVLLKDNVPESVFKGALACRKSLKVVTSSNLSSNEHDLCRMKIYGAVVCGIEDKKDDSSFKNRLFSTPEDKSVDISYLDITYSSENIDFLNRTIGVPMLTFWSDM